MNNELEIIPCPICDGVDSVSHDGDEFWCDSCKIPFQSNTTYLDAVDSLPNGKLRKPI